MPLCSMWHTNTDYMCQNEMFKSDSEYICCCILVYIKKLRCVVYNANRKPCMLKYDTLLTANWYTDACL